MFRKRQQIERYWLDKDYMHIRTIRDMHELNESQKRLKLVDNGEYEKTKQDILAEIERTEINLNAFDDMMGNPMEQLDGMMEIFNDKS